MIPLSAIPEKYHEALAAERVDVERRDESWTLLSVEPGRHGSVYVSVSAGPRRITEDAADALALPHTPRNVRALAVVLAGACGLDASAGVLARLTVERLLWLEVNTITGGVDLARAGFAPRPWHALHRGCPALSTIDPTTPDALLRALAECLRALTETTV